MYKALLVLSPALLFFGCETAAENQKDANQAQIEANREVAKVQAEARDQVVKAQAKADEGIAAANADYQKLREDFRHDVNTRLVALDETIAKAEAKIATETGESRAKLEAQVPAVRARRDDFVRQFEALKDVGAANWDSAKASLEKQWTELKSLADRTID